MPAENPFFEHPILNGPYDQPNRHWELDSTGQPTQKIVESRRCAEFITPIPKPRKRKGQGEQASLILDEGQGLTSAQQQYAASIINELRAEVDAWRALPSPSDWLVTPETTRLLQHWRHHEFNTFRPFFCQVEAVETAIWLTEVAPKRESYKNKYLKHLIDANKEANPELLRLALKLATGAGKTIVALHRAMYLAEAHPTTRVLLTTFSDILANALRTKLRLLIGNKPRLGEQIEVLAMQHVGLRLYDSNLAAKRGKPKIATNAKVKWLIEEASAAVPDHKFSLRFLLSEWEQVIDAWQLKTWEDYRDVARLGRRTRLRETQRELLWSIFSRVLKELSDSGEMTEAELFTRLAKHYAEGASPPFDFAVVDEAQDVSIAELRCLAAMAGGTPNGLFFAGDTGQRIFQQPFSWKSVGVDVRGRSSGLKVNYRTSHQIRMQADRLLNPEISDVDGNVEDRRGTVSVFNGPAPQIVESATEAEEQSVVAGWLKKRIEEGLRPDEMVIFVRSTAQLPRAELAAGLVKLPCKALGMHMETTMGSLTVCTMHLAKGLEFRAAAVMACDEDVLPLQERMETATDQSEVEDIYNTERQLLYVACTRARDCLLLTSAGTPSEFLRDLGG